MAIWAGVMKGGMLAVIQSYLSLWFEPVHRYPVTASPGQSVEMNPGPRAGICSVGRGGRPWSVMLI